MTAIVDAVLTVLLIAAMVRRGGALTWILVTAFAASSLAGPLLHGIDRVAVLATIDAAIVLGMAAVWTHTYSMTAYSIGFVGMVKCGLRLTYATNPHMDHYVYAAAINCAFALQVLIAGGYTDALGNRLDGMLRRVLPRRYGLLRNGDR